MFDSNNHKLFEKDSGITLTLDRRVVQNLFWPFEKDLDLFYISFDSLLL